MLMYRRELVSELDPAMAPFLLSYGKALYELALSQSGVMGKEEVQKGTQGQCGHILASTSDVGVS